MNQKFPYIVLRDLKTVLFSGWNNCWNYFNILLSSTIYLRFQIHFLRLFSFSLPFFSYFALIQYCWFLWYDSREITNSNNCDCWSSIIEAEFFGKFRNVFNDFTAFLYGLPKIYVKSKSETGTKQTTRILFFPLHSKFWDS